MPFVISLLVFLAGLFCLKAQVPESMTFRTGFETKYFYDPECNSADDLRGAGYYHYCDHPYYVEENYTGLADDVQLVDMDVSPSGEIWIVSRVPKISRYDGITWTNYYPGNSPIEPNDEIRNIKIDPTGQVWLGIYKRIPFVGNYAQLVKFSESGMERINITDSLGSAFGLMHDLEIASDGTLWGSTSGGIFSYDGSRVTALIDSSYTGDYGAMAVDHNDNIWVAADFIRFYNGSWTTYDSTNSSLVYGRCTDILVDQSNEVWVATGVQTRSSDAKGIFHFNGSSWTRYFSGNSNLPDDDCQGLGCDVSGNIWAGLTDGIYQFDDPDWTFAGDTTINMLNTGWESRIPFFAADTLGNLWGVTARRGLAQYDGTNWISHETFTTDIPYIYEFQNAPRTSVGFDNSDNVWLGAGYPFGSGMAKYDGANWSYFYQPSGFAFDSDQQGNIWTVNERTFSLYDGFDWTTYTYADIGIIPSSPSNVIECLYADNNGNIWLGNSRASTGLVKYNGAVATQYNSSNSNKNNGVVYDIVSDSSGNLWMATQYGLEVFDGTDFFTYDPSNSGLPDDDISLIAIDAYSNIWAYLSTDGIVRYDGKDWMVFDGNNSALPSNVGAMRGLVADELGNIWMGSNGNGLFQFDGYEWRVYNQLNSSLTTNDVRVLGVDHDHQLWLLVDHPIYDKYIVKFDPFANPRPVLKGIVYYDADSNGVRNTEEIGVPNQKILLLPDSTITFSNHLGIYHFDVDTGKSYTVTYFSDSNWYLNSSPISYTISVDSMNQITRGNDFGVVPLVDAYQCEAFITASPSRCSETGSLVINFKNNGTVYANGTLKLHLDPLVNYLVATVTPTYSLDTLVWNFSNLAPGETREITVFAMMPDASALGDTLSHLINMRLVNPQGQIAAQSTKQVPGIVRCAFDPNDKLVFPDGLTEDNYTLLNEAIDYTIRFQNTGNDTAVNVIIRDTLDHSLDINSFVPISSSHPVETFLENNGAVTFSFKNIFLPDSNVNKQTSQGFVKFRVKAKTGTAHLSTIENSAHIYFDFNSPVATNTVINTMLNCDSIVQLNISAQQLCTDDTLEINYSKTGPVATSWYFNGLPLGDTNRVSIPVDSGGTFNTELQANLRSCNQVINKQVIFGPLSNFDLSVSGATQLCDGETLILSTGYLNGTQWYKNNMPVTDSIRMEYVTGEPGTYYAIVSNGGCQGISDTVTVNLTPVPIANIEASGATTFCYGESVLLVSDSVSGNQWYRNGMAYTDSVMQTFHVTASGNYYTEINNGACSGFSDTITVVVNTSPTVTLAPFAPVCANEAAFTLTGGSPSGGWYTGIGVNGSTFEPAVAGTGTFTITYAFLDSNGCGKAVSQQIKVVQLPNVSLGLFNKFCLNDNPVNLINGVPQGGSYSGPGMSGNLFDPALAGTGMHTISYSFIDSNGCSNTAIKSVTIYPNPIVTLAPFSDICENVTTITLTGGTPPGGMFFGPYVHGNSFKPSQAGPGSHTLEYYYSDSNGCSASANQEIIVHALPEVDMSDFDTICENEAPVLLTHGSPAGGYYVGDGINGQLFDPANAGNGTHLITYIYTDSNGCTDSISKNVLVEVCTGLSATLSGYFNLYPNPIQNSLNLEFVTTRSGKVELMNLMGEKVKEVQFENLAKLQTDMTELSPGIYFLNIKTETESATIKVIKQ